MNLFSSLGVTPELRNAMSQARSALQQRADADLAVASNARSIEAANATIPALESAAARLHAESIKCEALASANSASKADVNKAVKAADKAALDLAEKKRELERATAARGVLVDMARDADTVIVLTKATLTSALAGYREQLLGGLEDDLRAACAGSVSLMRVLAAARAVDAEFPGGLCRPLLDNLTIISPRTYRVSHDEIGRQRVSGTDLLAEEVISATLPEEAALSLRDIKTIVDAFKRHKAFTMPKIDAPLEPYEIKSSSVTERKRWAAERANAAEWSPPKSTWVAGPTNVREPGTPVPARLPARASNEVNTAAASAATNLDGNISDEWRRIGAFPPESADQRSS